MGLHGILLWYVRAHTIRANLSHTKLDFIINGYLVMLYQKDTNAIILNGIQAMS